MKTIEQIVDRIQKDKNDPFGFVADGLIRFVPYDAAKPLLSEEAEKHYPDGMGWDATPLTREAVAEQMRSYMEFAWGKVYDHRGLSAGRSVVKMAAWLWLIDEDELAAEILKPENYPMYGAPALAIVCRKMGFPIPDDKPTQNMIEGNPCEDDCEEGCA